jgi:large subunit ribosomal protein L5
MTNLEHFYKTNIIDFYIKKYECNIMEVPKITKITLSMGVGEASRNKKVLDFAMNDIKLITGQLPIITYAKKSISGFKIRTGWPIGCKVTLRNDNMYNFLDKLIHITIPRIKDFRGFSRKSFDKQANYNIGIKEQIIFPEIIYDKIDKIRGLNIAITTNSNNRDYITTLLKLFHFPIK